MADGTKHKWTIVFGIVAGAAVVAAAALSHWAAQGKVTGDTPAARIASIRRLADDRPPGAAVAVAGAIDDPDAGVRRAALTVLAQFPEGYHRAVGSRINDPVPAVRAAAAATLGMYDEPDVAAALRRMLTDPVEEVRLGALTGLGRMDQPDATAALFAAAEGNDNVEVRRQAMRTLAARLKLRFETPPDPVKTPRRWRRALAQMRRMPPVRDALAGEG